MCARRRREWVVGRLTPLNFLAQLGRAIFSPRLHRRSKLTQPGNVVENMSALVAYGGSDEEDAVESSSDGELASEVRLRLSSPRFMTRYG